MLKNAIEKFYNLLFLDENQEHEVPYANKAFMFYFSLILFMIIVVLIGLDIAENIRENLN